MWASRRYKTMEYQFDIPELFRDYEESGYKDLRDKSGALDKKALINQLLKRTGAANIEQIGVPSVVEHDSWRLWKFTKFACDYYDEVSKKFQEFALANPWVKEYYEFCLDKGFSYTDPLNNVNGYDWKSVSKDKGEYAIFKADMSFKNFCHASNLKYLAIFNELRRPVPFTVGNIVSLRSAYLNKDAHDPFRNKTGMNGVERIGIITEILDSTHGWSYSGKGSRLVSVLWSATGEKSNHSINSLKLLNRKDKVVNRLVERSYDDAKDDGAEQQG